MNFRPNKIAKITKRVNHGDHTFKSVDSKMRRVQGNSSLISACRTVAQYSLIRYNGETTPGEGRMNTINAKQHEYWMELAMREAEVAMRRKEVPVGALIVKDGAVIAKGSNQTEMLQDPTAHAEIIAITAAAAHLESWRLEGCTIYVTLEPCPMCAGAIVLARLPLLIFGAYDPKAGACSSLYTITNDTRLNHRVHTVGGVLEEKCGSMLKGFFLGKRGVLGGR